MKPHSERSSELYRTLFIDTSTNCPNRRLVAIVEKWNMRIGFLKPRYAQWYDNQDFDEDDLDGDEQRELLFPCWRFDHPKGFATATRFLAYNISRHITECNPCRLECNNLHLPQQIISKSSHSFYDPALVFDSLKQSYRSAQCSRGRLRTILLTPIDAAKEVVVMSNCKCHSEVNTGYDRALMLTGA